MELPLSCAETLSSRSWIDRLGERLCKFSSTPKVLDDIQCFRLFRLMCMKTSLGIVANARLPDHSVISVRLKRIPSIQRKIERSTTNLSQVDDIIGLRIICQSLSDAVELSSRMESVSNHKRIKNYISEPRNTGYRATHHIFEFSQEFPQSDKFLRVSFEVQIRTYRQHMWAIYSESFGERAKEGVANSETKRELSSLSERIREWEEKYPSVIQKNLPRLTDTYNLAVVLCREGHDADCYFFQQDYQSAVDQLMYWEMFSIKSRDNTLLLAGMSKTEEKNVQDILKLTHPTFFGISYPPQSWIPPV